jgi:hypothetical protein
VAVVILLLPAAGGYLFRQVHTVENDRLDVQYQECHRYLYLHRFPGKQDAGHLFTTGFIANGLCQTTFFNGINYFDLFLYCNIIYLSVYNSIQASKK